MSKRPAQTRPEKQRSSTAGRSNEAAKASDAQPSRIESQMRRPGIGRRILLVVAACALFAWLALLMYMAFR